VLHRALGHASGNAPDDPPDAPKTLVDLETPINIFSAAKAVTAMVIHKLDERRVLHLEDRVCDFIPEFERYDKHHITLRHILAHRAGIPNVQVDTFDLDLLNQPDAITEILCEARLQSRPGRVLAYHAVSGGFVLAEVVRRATGHDIRTVLEREIPSRDRRSPRRCRICCTGRWGRARGTPSRSRTIRASTRRSFLRAT
jgi:CubicO group peptidase (beta-lactamase class C family)